MFYREVTSSIELTLAPLNDRASRSLHLLVMNTIKSININQEFNGSVITINLNNLSLIQRKCFIYS